MLVVVIQLFGFDDLLRQKGVRGYLPQGISHGDAKLTIFSNTHKQLLKNFPNSPI